MTATTHASGTDRLAEAVSKLGIGGNEIVVNVQGDEPLMPPALIRELGHTLAANDRAAVATACHAITDPAEFNNPNVVKVVRDSNGFALYFSRAPIPYPRSGASVVDLAPGPLHAHRHIGIYAYRAEFIARYAGWPVCPLEEIETLEQLRVLWHGERIAVFESASAPPAGVDTASDLEKVRRLLAQWSG
jgi:3-deoxy-manno-octulosonate cytidylyltransferase (CMP-KDO synthetase)